MDTISDNLCGQLVARIPINCNDTAYDRDYVAPYVPPPVEIPPPPPPPPPPPVDDTTADDYANVELFKFYN